MDKLKECPVCGCGMIHPVGIYVRTEDPEHGPEVHRITARGYDVSSVYEEEHPRGVVIIREYLGECGHRWMEREQFHKGNTFQSWKQLDPLVGPNRVIWRD